MKAAALLAPDQITTAQLQGGRERTSIAVLPFSNLSDSPDQDYLADGLTLDISTDLPRNAWLYVIAPGSMSNYRSHNTDYRSAVQDLGAHYVVEGSLRLAGDKIRINAALVDATKGCQSAGRDLSVIPTLRRKPFTARRWISSRKMDVRWRFSQPASQ